MASPARSRSWLSPPIPRGVARLLGRQHEHAPEFLDFVSDNGRVLCAHPALRLLAVLARAVRGLRQQARALSWRTSRDVHEDVRHVACLARQEERGWEACMGRRRTREQGGGTLILSPSVRVVFPKILIVV